MTTSKPGRGSDQFPLRLPDGMRDQIKEAADRNGRSMNAEIVARLEASFTASASVTHSTLAEALAAYGDPQTFLAAETMKLRHLLERFEQKGMISKDEMREMLPPSSASPSPKKEAAARQVAADQVETLLSGKSIPSEEKDARKAKMTELPPAVRAKRKRKGLE